MQESSNRAFEVLFCELQYLNQFFAGMLAQQIQDFCIVITLHYLFDGLVTLFFGFAFLVHYLAADQCEYCQADQCYDSKRASEMDNHSYKETDGKCRTGSDEPATDYTEYSCYTEYGRVTSPGPVGK